MNKKTLDILSFLVERITEDISETDNNTDKEYSFMLKKYIHEKETVVSCLTEYFNKSPYFFEIKVKTYSYNINAYTILMSHKPISLFKLIKFKYLRFYI